MCDTISGAFVVVIASDQTVHTTKSGTASIIRALLSIITAQKLIKMIEDEDENEIRKESIKVPGYLCIDAASGIGARISGTQITIIT